MVQLLSVNLGFFNNISMPEVRMEVKQEVGLGVCQCSECLVAFILALPFQRSVLFSGYLLLVPQHPSYQLSSFPHFLFSSPLKNNPFPIPILKNTWNSGEKDRVRGLWVGGPVKVLVSLLQVRIWLSSKHSWRSRRQAVHFCILPTVIHFWSTALTMSFILCQAWCKALILLPVGPPTLPPDDLE